MTVPVPFQLRRHDGRGPASALFVPDRDPAAPLAICARLGLDPSGRIHDAARGFLLKLERPSTEPMPGAIRLRERAADFYLPVDAELIPALLDDEAEALVRHGGLVFLPGGRILRFDRRAPVDVGKLLRAAPRPARTWAPLPEPRRLADRIAEIAWELPEPSPEALYQELGQDLRQPGSRLRPSRVADEPGPGDESGPGDAGAADPSGELGTTDPAGGGTGPESAGGAAGGRSGGGLMPGVQGLVQSLRGLLGRAGAGFATLKEKWQWEWVDHSTLVRKLLREFREGDPARALRQAMPLAAPGEPRLPARADRLPWSDAIYNLFDLLRRPGRGEFVAVLPVRAGIIEELAREYRKAAEAAVRQGDFRRAAYIYGLLLRDDRTAAQVLQRGGLHRDAATLYLKKLNDPAAAALAFEAAGEVDRALALHRRLGRYEAAGDLLRRIGEEDAAVAEYVRAAAVSAAAVPPNHLAAGSLLVEKARRPDLAIEQFRAGWARRPDRFAAPCGGGLARLYAERGAIEPLRSLLDEADAFFESIGSEVDAGSFYNSIALLAAGTTALGPFAEEVRDRALRALARKLRQSIERGRPSSTAVSILFGRSASWPVSLLSDAEFAATAARSQARGRDAAAGRDPRVEGVQVGRGTVTAACQASATDEVFLGFDSGSVLGYRPGSNRIVTVAEGPLAVTSLAVDPDGQAVVALRQSERGAVMSCAVRRPDGSFRTRHESHFPGLLGGWLTPVLPRGVDYLVGLGDPAPRHDLLIVNAVSGTPWGRVAMADAIEEAPTTAILLPVGSAGGPAEDRFIILTHDGPWWILVDCDGRRLGRSGAVWRPAAPGPRPLRSVPLAWRHAPPLLELVGLDNDGAVHAAQFWVEDRGLELLASRVATIEGGYLAATFSATFSGISMVVAVSRTRIDWLGSGTDRFRPVSQLKLSLPATIACFPSLSPREVLAVGSDGFLARIAAPRRAGLVGDDG